MNRRAPVHEAIADRLKLRPGLTHAVGRSASAEVAVRLRGGSMRGLEAVLAFTSIGTALAIGLGR